jgi:hypothetical protein
MFCLSPAPFAAKDKKRDKSSVQIEKNVLQ